MLAQRGPFSRMPPEEAPAAGAAQSWQAAVVANGGTVSAARLSIVNNLISGLMADGSWAMHDRLWLLAAENSQSALIDLKGLTTATPGGTPLFTADRGYTFDGVANLLNTNFVPNTGVQYTQNSGHISCYVRNNRTTATGFQFQVGSYDGVSNSGFCIRPTITTVSNVNNSPDFLTSGVTTTMGMHVVSRTGAAIGNVAYYIDGVAQTVSGGSASVARNSTAFYVGACNGAGGTNAPDQISLVGFGAGLTAPQATALRGRLLAYLSTVGAV